MSMRLQLRNEVVERLNQQYKTQDFHGEMSAKELVQCAEHAMRRNLDIINYDLTTDIIERYAIKIKYGPQHPFTQEQTNILQDFLVVIANLLTAFNQKSDIINKHLEALKDHIVKYGTKLRITQQYHKYLLYFKYINIKEAIIFETLSGCQVFYTIQRERKKSGKEYYMDPLINCYEDIKAKLKITHSFHEKVLPRKQLRYFQKKSTDKKMNNALFDAVSNRKYKEVKELIAKGASIEQPGISERTKRQMNCSHRASQLGDLQLCKILDSFKVNWQARDKQGMTPLHFAVQSGSLGVVQFLIEIAKVNIQPYDIQERTPFYFACTEGDMDIITYLYSKGADINNKSRLGRSALSKACYLGLVDVVAFLMKCPGIVLNSADGKGRTALHNSVFGPKGGREGHKFGTNQKDSPQCTQLLLQNGFDVDILDIQKNTPMHVSMSSDGIDSIKILLAFNASLTKLNEYGETPLMTGSKFGHLESVVILKEEYGAELTIKDVFNKNLMLLCAKFRQDDGKNVNRVFYYSTDELLKMAKENYPLKKEKNFINDWQEEIDHTFSQLLKERARVDIQFKYFCKKVRQYGLNVYKLSLQHIKSLLDMIKNTEHEEELQLVHYFLCKRPFNNSLNLNPNQFNEFIKWVISQNSTRLFDFIAGNQKEITRYLHAPSQFSTFFDEIARIAFSMLHEVKQKVLTYCLLKLNINWIDFFDQQKYDNILHLLVRHKKVGTLIQVLKTLSGVKIDLISNKFILQAIKQDQQWKLSKQNGESPLQLLLKSMLLHKNREGFDPYHLALLIKDASTSKLLEEKMQTQQVLGKSQFQVKQYAIMRQEDAKETQAFNKGFEIESQLDNLLSTISQSKNRGQLSKAFHILKESSQLDKQVNIDGFNEVWKSTPHRKLNEISTVQQVQKLNDISQSKVLGIDIEYFYADGVTLISIMQLSTLKEDYIIDFLTSAKSHEESYNFIQAVKKILTPIAYSRDIIKIMHGSDNDLCVIKSILNLSFLNFIDTARIDVDIRKQQNIRGLATLVNEYLHEFMSKDYQVSEWRIRPIPISMLDYARRDSMVLPFLARKLLLCADAERLGEILTNGCKHARRNRKTSQPLIRSMKAI